MINPKLQNYKGYLGNETIKRAGVQVEWTKEAVVEMAKCAEDPLYFAENYMRIITADGDMVKIELYDYQKDIIQTLHENRRTVVLCARQAGKALPLDTPIATPGGWKTMSQLETGHQVFDENGKPTTILSTSKVFYNHDCYQITFDDKSSVKADAEHLWVVNRSSSKNPDNITMTTKQLFDSEPIYQDSRGKLVSKWKIPLAKPVQYENKPVLIDPYTLGVWLGDGEAASGRICGLEEDINFYKNNTPHEFSHNHSPNKNLFTTTLYGLSAKLRQLNLIKNKKIPREYLFNDVETRLALLQGLMDTDGWVEKSGQNGICFSNSTYPQLIDDVYELLTGLGLKVFRKEKPKVNATLLYFHCSKEMFNVFRLPRKLEKQIEKSQASKYTSNRYIRKIEKIDSVPTKCIEVSNASHMFLCSKHYIPTHNTTAVSAYILWYILFNENKNVAILGNDQKISQEILKRVQFAYEGLPKWLQQGVVEWNKTSCEFENHCRILSGACTKKTFRGFTIHLMFIDEVAFVENWDDFFTSTFNTMSNSKKNKIAMVSTPNGMNHFHDYWQGAISKEKPNGWKPVKITWQDVPGRDLAWKNEILAGTNFDYERFAQEHDCDFLGSSGTLIAGWRLKELIDVNMIPLMHGHGLYLYSKPVKGNKYVIVCDVSRGRGLDYSAFQVIDVSKMPYVQVCTYRDNLITPLDYAETIYRSAKNYNDAAVLVEINDIGSQVSEALFYDFEYENVMMTENAGRMGKRITAGFGGKEKDFGIRTTKPVKNVGCAILKLLIEGHKLELFDKYTIEELKTFSRKNNSYEAEQGKHDDMIMPLVLFAWLTDQQYFKELTDINTMQLLREKTEEQMMEEMLPFGFMDNGMDDMPTDEPKTVPSLDRWLLS